MFKGLTSECIFTTQKKRKDHAGQKIRDYQRALNSWLKRNPNASASDRHAAQEMLKDLGKAAEGEKNL